MKKLILLRFKCAFWFSASFVAMIPWFLGLLLLFEPSDGFWQPELFRSGMIFWFVFSLVTFFIAWLKSASCSADDCLRVIESSNGMIRICTFGLVRFKK